MQKWKLVFFAITFSLMSCADQEEQKDSIPANGTSSAEQAPETRYDCKTIDVEGGFGYDIYVDGNLYVHQTHIPAIPGTHPFASDADAWHVGSLAVQKMKQGIVPPTITVEEMQSLGVVLPTQN